MLLTPLIAAEVAFARKLIAKLVRFSGETTAHILSMSYGPRVPLSSARACRAIGRDQA
jgi:hypothetical protein